MLVKLQSRPDDVDLRRRAAEALDAQGKHDEAAMVLTPLVNISAHEADTGLPCLCKACLTTAGTTTTANELSFTRSFAVVANRVLHFWQLDDQPRAAVRASVGEALSARVNKLGWKK